MRLNQLYEDEYYEAEDAPNNAAEEDLDDDDVEMGVNMYY